jgi:hypothetical protein
MAECGIDPIKVQICNIACGFCGEKIEIRCSSYLCMACMLQLLFVPNGILREV